MTHAIVHVAGYASEYGGNFIASLARLRESCREQGWDMLVVFPEAARERPWCRELAAENWRLCFLPDNASRVRCAFTLARIISQEDARLVHAHFVHYDLAAWLAARLGGRRGAKVQVVWHAHSEMNARAANTPIRRFTNPVKYGLLAKSVWMIPVGRSVARGLIAAGVPESRVRIVENGIDLTRATADHNRET